MLIAEAEAEALYVKAEVEGEAVIKLHILHITEI